MTPPVTRLERTVEYLAALRLEGRRVDALPADLEPATMADAYRAQAGLVARLAGAWGGAPVGYKIALTNPAAQAMLGVPHPVFGRILSSRLHASGARLRAADYAVRVMECEVGFRMGADVPPADRPYDRDSIASYVATAMPALELVEYHFAGIDRVTACSLAADNAIHGAWIRGAETSQWRSLALDDQPTRLLVDGEVRLEGNTGKVLGHPLAALAWLADALPAHGLRLRAGDLVTTGITTDQIHLAQPGEQVSADLGPLGTVTIAFS